MQRIQVLEIGTDSTSEGRRSRRGRGQPLVHFLVVQGSLWRRVTLGTLRVRRVVDGETPYSVRSSSIDQDLQMQR